MRSFMLPCQGRVLVQIGQTVAPGDVIAEAQLPGHYQVFDVIKNLGVRPDRLDQSIKRLTGDTLAAGDVIAQKNGVLSRIYRAAEDGQVLSVRGGRITSALGIRTQQVQAAFPGQVVQILPERGAVVAAQGALLEAAWSSGGNVHGSFQTLAPDFANLGRSSDSLELGGKICFIESISAGERLRRVLALKPAAFIFQSVSGEALPELGKSEIPLFILAGFGDLQVDRQTRDVLTAMEGGTVYCLGADAHSRGVVFLPAEGETSQALLEAEETIHTGSLVRLLGLPYTGSIGTVIELPEAPERFASGLSARAAVVKRDDQEVIRVPLENLELLLT